MSNANVILMGTDRTSIHKADLCLPGQGWQIIQKETPVIEIQGRSHIGCRWQSGP